MHWQKFYFIELDYLKIYCTLIFKNHAYIYIHLLEEKKLKRITIINFIETFLLSLV